MLTRILFATTLAALPLLAASSGSAGQATAVAVSPEGHLITNRHAVDDCDALGVQASSYVRDDAPVRPAQLVATSDEADLAVLQADLRPDAPHAPILVWPDWHVFVPTPDTRVVQGGFPVKPDLDEDSDLQGKIQVTFAEVHTIPDRIETLPHSGVMAAATSYGGSGSGVFTSQGYLVGLVYAGGTDELTRRLQRSDAWPENPMGPPVVYHTLTPIARFMDANDVPLTAHRTDKARDLAGNSPVHGWVIAVTYKMVCR